MAGKRIRYKGPVTPGNRSINQFVSILAPLLVKYCVNTGILPSVVVGIALKESSAGNDYKAFVFNNPFGHKAFGTWDGDGVKRTDNPNAAYWRVYPSLEEAVKSHVAILQGGNYKKNGVALQKTPYNQLVALQKAGYNVGGDKHEYAASITNIIRSRGLQKFDQDLFAYERSINNNSLAFHEQDGITKALHNLLA
jgi:flagellum-specific peptidoglycan hydrolase FlgJ